MKTIKEITTSNESGEALVQIIYADGKSLNFHVNKDELKLIEKGDRRVIEFIIAKYLYRSGHSHVGVWRYLGNNNEICSVPLGKDCGQCKHFQQTGYYYSEIFMGTPSEDSLPYPTGKCNKHGFGPRLSAYRNADGSLCGWEIADWCKLDDRKLSADEEKKLRDLWK